MIRYALACDSGHEFDSWFASADSFDALSAAGHVACPECGATDVRKALMAPGIGASGTPDTAPGEGHLSAPRSEREKALAALRRKVETESEYVGLNFATEARAMHDGVKPTRSIYGEARVEEAKRLLEDGIPVAPLPFTPRSRAN